jgi:hypothetical protein
VSGFESSNIGYLTVENDEHGHSKPVIKINKIKAKKDAQVKFEKGKNYSGNSSPFR